MQDYFIMIKHKLTNQAIAATALSTNAPMATVTAAGQHVAVALILLTVPGLLPWVSRTIPTPLVKGIQLGAALTLLVSANAMLSSATTPLALALVLLLVAAQLYPRTPSALLLFLLAITLALTTGVTAHIHLYTPHIQIPSCISPSAASMAIGQLPLTLLNSIVAVPPLSTDLLPDTPPPTISALAWSVALMNIIGGWFGCMPVCHGSGGLAAQYYFGARSGASIMILGALKLLLGLVYGDSLSRVMAAFPRSCLAVMVLGAGVELARVGASVNRRAPDLINEDGYRCVGEKEARERWNVMLLTAATTLVFRNTAIGFLAGLLSHTLLHRPTPPERQPLIP